MLDHCGGHGLGGLATEERRFARNVKLDVGEAAFGVKRHGSLHHAELAHGLAFVGARRHGGNGAGTGAAKKRGKRRLPESFNEHVCLLLRVGQGPLNSVGP